MDLSTAVLPIAVVVSVVCVGTTLGVLYGDLRSTVRHLQAKVADLSQQGNVMVEVLNGLAELRAEVRALRRDVDAHEERRAG